MLPDNEELFSNYFTLRSVTENTKNVYLATLKKWDEVTGISLHDLDEKTLARWYKELSKEYASSTIEKYARNLRSLYAYTLEQEGQSKRKARVESQEPYSAPNPAKPVKNSTRNQHPTHI